MLENKRKEPAQKKERKGRKERKKPSSTKNIT